MEGRNAAQPIVETTLQSLDTYALVYHYLEEHIEPLLGTLHTFILSLDVVRYGGETIQEMASELLNEVFAEALSHSERYDCSRQLGAWLYGIALNVTRRKKAERAKQYGREASFSSLQYHSDAANDDAFFDQFISFAIAGPEQDTEAKEQFELLISLISEDDQQILRLTILHDLDNARLAHALGIKEAAARQRLHRAFNRLRAILKEQGGESNV